MSGRDLTQGELLTRGELVDYLPENWPGLTKSLNALARVDGLAVLIVRRLLVSAKLALEADDRDNARATLLELLEGAVITREAHEARVNELLAANNQLLEKTREGQRARQFLHMVATMTAIEADCDAGSLRDEARALIGSLYPGENLTRWRPRYGENERDRAASIIGRRTSDHELALALVDEVAEALGMERAG